MKRELLVFIISVIFVFVKAQETFVITADGDVFDPSDLTVTQGDIVQFNAGFNHPVLQVSESTWNSNGTTLLTGGFYFSSGTGTYNAETLGTFYYICVHHIGSGMKGRIIVNATTNLEPIKFQNSFRIFPNYSTDFLNILNTSNLPIKEVRIIDLSGKIILSLVEFNSSEEEFSIDVNQLNKGIYFIYVELGNTKISRKFVKL